MKRALIVKLGAIGDVLMAVPAAHALHQQGFAIDWLCGHAVAPLLGLYPWINVLPMDEQAILKGSTPARLKTIASQWNAHFGTRYHLIATLYYDERYRLLTLPIRATRRIALSHEDRTTRLIPGRPHIDEYARILLNRDDNVNPVQLAPIRPSTIPASPLPRTERPRIALVPAGARNLLREDILRRWPVENYVTLARELTARGHEVVLIGGPGDEWASVLFAGLPVIDQIGKLSLVDSLALLDSCDVTISHDTGPLHLAGISSSAIVAIFGPTMPQVFLPRRANVVGLWGGEHLACRPCYDGRHFAPCSNNACVQEVSPGMVLRQVESLLAARRAGQPLPPRILEPSHA